MSVRVWQSPSDRHTRDLYIYIYIYICVCVCLPQEFGTLRAAYTLGLAFLHFTYFTFYAHMIYMLPGSYIVNTRDAVSLYTE